MKTVNTSVLSDLSDLIRPLVRGPTCMLLCGSRGKGIGYSLASDWDVVVITLWSIGYGSSSDSLEWLRTRGWAIMPEKDIYGPWNSSKHAWFNFHLLATNVQVWLTDYPTFEHLTKELYVPFLVEAVRLAHADPQKNFFFLASSDDPSAYTGFKSCPIEESERRRAALSSGREWWDKLDWGVARRTFLQVCDSHIERATGCNGQPLCRKTLLHVMWFIDTACWLMRGGDADGQHLAALPASFDWKDLAEAVLGARMRMQNQFAALEGAKRAANTPIAVVPASDVTLANNRTLVVPLPILDMILQAAMGRNGEAPEPRDVYSLLQVCRLFRSKVDVLLKELILRVGSSRWTSAELGAWVCRVVEPLSLGHAVRLWARICATEASVKLVCWQCGRGDACRLDFQIRYPSWQRCGFPMLEDILTVFSCSCQYNREFYDSGSTFFGSLPEGLGRDRWQRLWPSLRQPDTDALPKACFYCEQSKLSPGKIQCGIFPVHHHRRDRFFVCEKLHIWAHEEVEMPTLKWNYVYATPPLHCLSGAERERAIRERNAVTPCRFWSVAKCPTGAACQFKHDGPEGNGDVCHQWMKRGKCPRRKCKFLHIR